MDKLIVKKAWINWVIFFVTIIVVFLLGLFASSISERRAEAQFITIPQQDIAAFEPRNAVWGEIYPRQYESYMKTADTTFKSMYNSAGKDDVLEQYPALVVLWAGYAFSRDYNQGRGHYYAVEDTRNTLRTGGPTGPNDGMQPATCWTCKSPDVPRMMNEMGIAEFYKGRWASLGHEMNNFIGCADCHDHKTMNLHISRPALKEAFERMGKDISKATRNEMRSLVCAQCHVEYYFKGEGFYLTFPWDKGLSVEAMEEYYDEIEFSDWTHAISKAPMIKAQHPDYEVFKMGVHYQRGVSCADCHMPYMSQGGVKFTNHHIQSPLNHIHASCQVCHRQSEETLRQNVYERQGKIAELRKNAEDALFKAHIEAKAAWDAGATADEMKEALRYIRHAQWRWDFAVAGHGNSFHAPVEIARILATSVDKAQQARLMLFKVHARYGVKEVSYPDISTKEKAQTFIGLNIKTLQEEKKVFLDNIVPRWDAHAKDRQKKM